MSNIFHLSGFSKLLVRTAPSSPATKLLIRRTCPSAIRWSTQLSHQPTGSPSRSTDPRSSDAKPHRAFYSNFGLAVFKTFLTALFTYQILYWGWLKLEGVDRKMQGSNEVRDLEDKVRALVDRTREGTDSKL